jgi:predicted dehydrogenase
LKLLIIGLGSIAQKHIDAIIKINQFATIYALRSNTNAKPFTNIIDLYKLSDVPNDIDFILISNPTSLHSKTILNVIDFNKPLFIEKPVFDSVINNDEIVRLIKEKNIKTYVACNLRFHPALIFLRDYLNSNNSKVNEVNVYCGSYLPNWRPPQDYTKSYSANQKLGGGVHLDLIHELDYTIWIFGKPVNYKSIKRKVSNLLIDTFDYTNYNLSYPDFNVSITLNYYRSTPKRQIEIVLENEILICDLLTSTILNSENKIIFIDNEFDFSKTYLNQMNYFINNLKNENMYMNDINESFEILKIALND